MLRIEPDRFVKVGHGAIEIAVPAVRYAAIVEEARILGSMRIA